jgi:hypothetical protein
VKLADDLAAAVVAGKYQLAHALQCVDDLGEEARMSETTNAPLGQLELVRRLRVFLKAGPKRKRPSARDPTEHDPDALRIDPPPDP